ncbi:unnamed protein product [Leptidea sinapis]|uniref:Secreted protein n=1 Tax=Leptidea sinapis TaxID=189913 RepID=A0A5E4QI99_9NEOP|nr:unnamed protein product [Leptidea sinapis]
MLLVLVAGSRVSAVLPDEARVCPRSACDLHVYEVPPPTAPCHGHDDSLGYEFPFTLRVVTRDGEWCARCDWPALCRGCVLPCGDDQATDSGGDGDLLVSTHHSHASHICQARMRTTTIYLLLVS